MFGEIKIHNVVYGDAISGSKVKFEQGYARSQIAPLFQGRDNNPFKVSTASYADSIMHFAAQMDGDLLLSAGWGDGFAVRRLENDGTLTMLYYDATPYSGYANYHSIALNRARGKVWVNNYVYDGVQEYDYSGVQNQGDGSVVKGSLHTSVLTNDENGYPYWNGIYCAGDYLYQYPDDIYADTCFRTNMETLVKDDLTVINKRNNGRYGIIMTYDEENDRLYLCPGYYYGELWVVVNASKSSEDPTNPAKCYCVRTNDVGLSFSTYGRNPACVISKDNPNHIFFGGHHRHGWIDITDCIDGDPPTSAIPSKVPGKPQDASPYTYGHPYNLSGYITASAEHPVHKSDYIRMYADRGYGETGGWYDQENNRPVMMPQRVGYYSEDPLYYDYGGRFLHGISANGTHYSIACLYGHDDGVFHVYEGDDAELLEPNAEIVLGTYTLDSGNDIGSAELIGWDVYSSSGTSISIYLSNNGGSTWESAAFSGLHSFSSTGSQVQIKIVMTGTATKASYIDTFDPPQIAVYASVLNSEPSKRTSIKLAGA